MNNVPGVFLSFISTVIICVINTASTTSDVIRERVLLGTPAVFIGLFLLLKIIPRLVKEKYKQRPFLAQTAGGVFAVVIFIFAGSVITFLISWFLSAAMCIDFSFCKNTR
jgi:hypothetical protein